MTRTCHACAVALLLLSGCSKGPSTPAGPLGKVDLASRLPGGVAVPPDTATREASLSVCLGGTGDTPASVHVSWKSFTKDGAGYVSSYAVELEKKVPGLVVGLDGDPKVLNANAVTKPGAPLLEVVGITLKCSRTMSSGSTLEESSVVYVNADGSSFVKK